MTYFETQTHRQTRTYTFRTYHQQESILGAKGKKRPKQLNEQNTGNTLWKGEIINHADNSVCRSQPEALIIHTFTQKTGW